MRNGYILGILGLLAAGCSGENGTPETVSPEPVEQQETGRKRVDIRTRAEEGLVANTPVRAGLFMVNYLDGKPDMLMSGGNYVHNQMMTYADGIWLTDTPIYWSDMDTPADFYAYAPYQERIPDAKALTFAVKSDQRTDEALTESDLLWGKLQGQEPTAEAFNLSLHHILSRLTVIVTAAQGFDNDELQPQDVSVTIGGTRTEACLNVASGLVQTLGEATDVVCHSNGDLSYTAILVPQTVPFSNLIQVSWRGNRYVLQNSSVLEGGKEYTLTVSLKKTKSGFDIGIEGWDIIGEDFGGTVGG